MAPPGNQAVNREDKLHPNVRGVLSLLKKDHRVVNHRGRRSKIGNFGILKAGYWAIDRDLFERFIGCRQRRDVGSRAEPHRIWVKVWNQAVSKKLKDRAGARGGALVGKPRWARILVITAERYQFFMGAFFATYTQKAKGAKCRIQGRHRIPL